MGDGSDELVVRTSDLAVGSSDLVVRRGRSDVRAHDDAALRKLVFPAAEAVRATSRTAARWRSIRRRLLVTDVVIAVGVTLGARAFGAPLRPWLVPVAVAAWIGVFGLFGLYPSRLLAAGDEARRTVGAAAAAALVLIALAQPSRGVTAAATLAALGAEVTARRGWRRLVEHMRADGRLALRTIIVGTGAEAGNLAHLLRVRGSGHVPLGFVATSGPLVSPNGLTVLGQLDRLEDAVRAYAVDCIFVAARDVADDEVGPVLRAAHRTGVSVRFSTPMPAGRESRMGRERVGGATALSLEPVLFTAGQAAAKRALDLVVATLGLVASAPLWVVIGAVIRLTSRGPVLFRQRRVTKDGAVFTMLKFRTMVPDAEGRLEGRDPSVPFFKVHDDVRITRIGRILRRTSLDELPQLINVLRGDMSMVGPRPLPAEQVEANADRLAPRHEARAGLTGWWQINGRSELDVDEALALDLYYIQNWSLGLDLTILWRTARAMMGRGAV